MEVLLIYPQYTHINEFDSRVPSMSLIYLASTLECHGHKVTIYDASLGSIVKVGEVFRYGFSDEDVYDFLKKQNFDIVGITCSFSTRWKFVSKIAECVKKISPDTPVVTGGLFPTYSFEYCLKNDSAIDFIMLGEAELTFAQVINNISKGYSIHDSCKDVDGVAWRTNGKIFCNQKHDYNDNLDDLPFPAWHLVDINKYFKLQKNIFELKTPCLPILSSRSCPYKCKFCNMYIVHGLKWRSRSPENVLNEVEYLMKIFNVYHFYFIDDNFSLDIERAKLICKGIIERKLNIKYNFHNGLSIKTIDEELVLLMKESGCTSVCLAIESGSERIRNEVYGKKLSTKKIFEVFDLFYRTKISTIAYFLVGAPTETRNDIEKSKELIRKLPVTLITVGIYTPYPETELYDECKKKGWLIKANPDSEDNVQMFSSMLKTPDFEPGDLISWQKELYFCFIRSHWFNLIKQVFRSNSVINFDTIGKFIGIVKFRFLKLENKQNS